MEKTLTRQLAVTLTDEEFIHYSEELARTLKEINELTIQRSRLNSLMKPKNERVDELVPIIDSKQVPRDVECAWTYYWEIGRRTLHRLDTYQVVEEDIIPENERQQRFDYDGFQTPGGDDPRFTETDEKAQNPVETVADRGDACPKCEGDGYYHEDGVEDGGGEVYCDCNAGAVLKAEADPGVSTDCEHPEGSRVVESNATICTDCGTVLEAATVERESQPVPVEPEGNDTAADGAGEPAAGELPPPPECGKNEFPIIKVDSKRNCCMPQQRAWKLVGTVKVLYCEECGLIHRKFDVSDPGREREIEFLLGEAVL